MESGLKVEFLETTESWMEIFDLGFEIVSEGKRMSCMISPKALSNLLNLGKSVNSPSVILKPEGEHVIVTATVNMYGSSVRFTAVKAEILTALTTLIGEKS